MKISKIIVATFTIIISLKVYAIYEPPNDIFCNEDYWVNEVDKSKFNIIATSILPKTGKYNYEPKNLKDNNIDTCWCPKGNGINEYIIMKIPKGIKGFYITNGVAKSEKLFHENNRVKKLYLALISERHYQYKEMEGYDICLYNSKKQTKNVYYTAYQNGETDPFNLKDTFERQKVIFAYDKYFTWDHFALKKTKDVYLVIGILDIYKGTKYNDTCISEIEIIK